MNTVRRLIAIVCLLTAWAGLTTREAAADVALLLGQPYGRFGAFSPTGHAALYLSHVCSDTPTVVRACLPGEPGVVISRYHRVAGRDWLAIPLVPYLYAVKDASAVPGAADPPHVERLRDAYRRTHLSALVPDGPGGRVPQGDWVQLIGAAYDREIVALTLPTTAAQDAMLVSWLNSQANTARFNILLRNCADFARDVLHQIYPGLVRNRMVADLGITTPKALARAVVRQAVRDGRTSAALVIPQIPGSRRPSGTARGILEGLVKTKKYVIPMAVAQPVVPLGLALGYVTAGRFNPVKDLPVAMLTPAEIAAGETALTPPGRR